MSRALRIAVLAAALAAGTNATALAQSLEPSEILKPEPGSWPTYSGDYSGRRYSTLKQINKANVKDLKPVFSTTLSTSPEGAIIAGEAPTLVQMGAGQVRGGVLQVDGVLYVSAPDHVWAVDARTGRVLWHFLWKTRGGIHIGNRGVGMWKDTIFVETPDNYLVALDAKTGAHKWHVTIASFEEQYFSTTAPIVIGDQVMVGTGNDLDMPGFLQSFDAATGKLLWKTYMVPMNPGDPGLETWKDLDAARHGGGNAWVPGSYDPETNLYIIGTGNPSPAYFPEARGNKEALFTCALVAIDVATGKMKWYYQTSPNESHDWDSAQTPILADIKFRGKTRKVVMTAARNGYFFVVDRLTGEHLLTTKFSGTANWAEPKLNAKGQPVRIPEKDHSIGGALVSAANPGASNWQPQAFSPETGLFYVHTTESWAMYYTSETDARGGTGLGGKEEIAIGGKQYLKAIDPSSGTIKWTLEYPTLAGPAGGRAVLNGLLTTAGGLLFGEDGRGNLVARDPATGKPYWHGKVPTATEGVFAASNAPHTYMLDGRQYIVIAGGSTLNAFALP